MHSTSTSFSRPSASVARRVSSRFSSQPLDLHTHPRRRTVGRHTVHRRPRRRRRRRLRRRRLRRAHPLRQRGLRPRAAVPGVAAAAADAAVAAVAAGAGAGPASAAAGRTFAVRSIDGGVDGAFAGGDGVRSRARAAAWRRRRSSDRTLRRGAATRTPRGRRGFELLQLRRRPRKVGENDRRPPRRRRQPRLMSKLQRRWQQLPLAHQRAHLRSLVARTVGLLARGGALVAHPTAQRRRCAPRRRPSTSRTAAAPRTRTSGGAAPAAAAGASADAAAAAGTGDGAGASALRKDRGTRPRRPSAF